MFWLRNKKNNFQLGRGGGGGGLLHLTKQEQLKDQCMSNKNKKNVQIHDFDLLTKLAC